MCQKCPTTFAIKHRKPKRQSNTERGSAGSQPAVARASCPRILQHGAAMHQTIGHIALIVRDYDEAIAFFTQSLGFELIEDTPSKDRQGRDKRWVLVAPPGSRGTQILLAKASNAEESSRIGNQTGGRVFLFLHTDDFWRDYTAMRGHAVEFVRDPKEESYGAVAVFRDLDGNVWDLIQRK